jgi:nucleotide-binding universal stress UspA family protein
VRADSGQAWRIATARADAELRELVSSIDPSGVNTRTLCVEGRNRSGVAVYAREVGADLIVCDGPRRRIRTLGRLLGDEYESLLTDLPSALLLAQIRHEGRSPDRGRAR